MANSPYIYPKSGYGRPFRSQSAKKQTLSLAQSSYVSEPK
jgi:hypothetical protein